MYLGYRRNVIKPIKKFDGGGYFAGMRHDAGGYVMYTDSGVVPLQVAVTGPNRIVTRNTTGTRWEFVQLVKDS